MRKGLKTGLEMEPYAGCGRGRGRLGKWPEVGWGNCQRQVGEGFRGRMGKDPEAVW